MKRCIKTSSVHGLMSLAESFEYLVDEELDDPIVKVSLTLRTCNNGKKVIVGNTPRKKPEPNPVLIDAIKTAI